MSLEHPQRRFAVAVVRRLQAAGFTALWAGGCVRDELRGTPPTDYDVATSARPAQVRDVLGPERTLPIGQAFGVIAVRGPRAAGVVEVATFRQDGVYSDGRHPDAVEFTDAEHDAQRRDFTINGLFLDPLSGQVFDYVGGVADLQAETIRAIGDPAARFAEDHLRLLRAPRFAARLQFSIEPRTLAAIRSHAHLIQAVAAERVGNEMRMMLGGRQAAAAVAWLVQAGLLPWIAPKLAGGERHSPFDTAVPEPATGEVDSRRLAAVQAALQRLAGAPFELALAALLWILADEPSAAVADVAHRWKLSNQERTQVAWLVDHVAELARGAQVDWPRLQRLLIEPWAAGGVDLARSLADIGPWSVADVQWSADRLAWSPERLNPPPLISGHDLQALLIPAGPLFAQILRAVRDAQLNGMYESRAQALAAIPALAAQLAKQVPPA